ncbi:hypothetical protein [Anabaena sp. CCY 0017]|uniref:hypothetical protein n=1 Tax=Anabaena sp. CCY 0017 TaxID=3103866 RepID=UPI0039C70A77
MTHQNIENEQYIIINFYSTLNVGRSAIEDELEDVLEDKGEVTGGGSGVSGSNIDIEIYEGTAYDFLNSIREVLKEFSVPTDTVIIMNGNERFSVYEESTGSTVSRNQT